MHADTAQTLVRIRCDIISRKLTPNMRPQQFQEDVQRCLKNHIRHEEVGQGDIELVALELEICVQTIDNSIVNVDATHASRSSRVSDTAVTTTAFGLPIQEGHRIQQTEHGQ